MLRFGLHRRSEIIRIKVKQVEKGTCLVNIQHDVERVLKATSRTFYIPISRLPADLNQTMSAAYLAMRAIDEIEDHPTLPANDKADLLREVSALIQAQTSTDGFNVRRFAELLNAYPMLPEVSLRLGEWLNYAPEAVAPYVWNHTAAMADRMAYWASKNWSVNTKEALDTYTFSVAGAIGLLICDVWMEFYGMALSSKHAIHFGRALQLVNIIRNRNDDAARGVSFFPHGWDMAQMMAYARHNLEVAYNYALTLDNAAFTYLIKVPLELAQATLDAIADGKEKISRDMVNQIVQQ